MSTPQPADGARDAGAAERAAGGRVAARLAALDLIERNPITLAEFAALDPDSAPDGVCLSCWAWHVIRGIKDGLPHDTCREALTA